MPRSLRYLSRAHQLRRERAVELTLGEDGLLYRLWRRRVKSWKRWRAIDGRRAR